MVKFVNNLTVEQMWGYIVQSMGLKYRSYWSDYKATPYERETTYAIYWDDAFVGLLVFDIDKQYLTVLDINYSHRGKKIGTYVIKALFEYNNLTLIKGISYADTLLFWTHLGAEYTEPLSEINDAMLQALNVHGNLLVHFVLTYEKFIYNRSGI